MASLPLADDAAKRRPWHGQVFTLNEITGVVGRYGLPDRYADPAHTADRFIEMQLWDDQPLLGL